MNSRYEDLCFLLVNDIIFEFDFDWHNGMHLEELQGHINCSDTFYYASADGTSIPIGREHEVREMYEKFGWAGVTAWCALLRNEEPLKEHQSDEYKAARKYLEMQEGYLVMAEEDQQIIKEFEQVDDESWDCVNGR